MIRRAVRRRFLLPIVLVLVVAGALVAWSPDLDAAAIAERVRAAGMLGTVGLLALLIVQCVVAPIPSEPIMMAAGFVYGPRPAFVIAWTGVVLGAALCFWLARAYGRSVAERIVRAERLDAAEAGVQRGGPVTTFAGLLALRAIAFHSFDIVSYACGLVRLPFPMFVAATALGSCPKVFAFTYAGATLAARPVWLDALILAGTLGALAVVVVGMLLRRRRAA